MGTHQGLPKTTGDPVHLTLWGSRDSWERHEKLPAHYLVLWEPKQGRPRPERPLVTFVDTLKRDVGAANTTELAVCMKNRDHCASRAASQLRPS